VRRLSHSFNHWPFNLDKSAEHKRRFKALTSPSAPTGHKSSTSSHFPFNRAGGRTSIVVQNMKNIRQFVAITAGLVLAIGWFIFADSDRLNLGGIIFGIGMSVAAAFTLVRQPMRMTRLVIVAILLPLLATLVVLEAKNPDVGWPLALVWSLILLGVLSLHAYLNRREPGEGGISKSAESNNPDKPCEATGDNTSS
jgi:uncharacterized membrane protein YccF (DUF307 family)